MKDVISVLLTSVITGSVVWLTYSSVEYIKAHWNTKKEQKITLLPVPITEQMEAEVKDYNPRVHPVMEGLMEYFERTEENFDDNTVGFLLRYFVKSECDRDPNVGDRLKRHLYKMKQINDDVKAELMAKEKLKYKLHIK